MARPREPIALIQAKGKKNLTKAEIAKRQASEVQPCTDNIVAPSYLTATQRKRFDVLAGQLEKIKIMGETDCEALARYITAQALYEQTVKELRKVQKERPKLDTGLEGAVLWAELLEKLDKRQDRYFKQATTAARDLGLTISSRCKLQVPIKEEAPKQNKFAQFEVIPGQKEAAGK